MHITGLPQNRIFELNSKSFRKHTCVPSSVKYSKCYTPYFKEEILTNIEEKPTITPIEIYDKMNRGSDLEVIEYKRLFNTISSIKIDHFSDLKEIERTIRELDPETIFEIIYEN